MAELKGGGESVDRFPPPAPPPFTKATCSQEVSFYNWRRRETFNRKREFGAWTGDKETQTEWNYICPLLDAEG